MGGRRRLGFRRRRGGRRFPVGRGRPPRRRSLAPRAASAAVAPAPVVAASLRPHDDRRPFLQFLDPDRQVTQDILVDAHVALHLVDRAGRRVEVHQDVMGLAVLLQPVGEGSEAPVFDLGDGAAAFLDDGAEFLRQRLDLVRGHVRAHEKHVLVKWHTDTPSGCVGPAQRRTQPHAPARSVRQGAVSRRGTIPIAPPGASGSIARRIGGRGLRRFAPLATMQHRDDDG